MKRHWNGLSEYEKEQTRRALAWKPIDLSARQRAGHRKQEQDLIRRALASLSPAALDAPDTVTEDDRIQAPVVDAIREHLKGGESTEGFIERAIREAKR